MNSFIKTTIAFLVGMIIYQMGAFAFHAIAQVRKEKVEVDREIKTAVEEYCKKASSYTEIYTYTRVKNYSIKGEYGLEEATSTQQRTDLEKFWDCGERLGYNFLFTI